MMHTVRFACPLDCFDSCGLAAAVQDGRVTGIRGDRRHPVSRGHACIKGKRLLERLYHPQRLRQPLRRTKIGWQSLSWEEAIALIAREFSRVVARWGPAAILFYADSGYGGMRKSVDRIFFNHLGGVSVPRGSLCWAAGLAAQRYDFGDVRGHAPHDMARARTVLLWSRNAVETSPHLMPFLQQARRAGGRIIAIDPIFTRTAAWADAHIQPRPGSDGALALGMAHHLVQQGRIDHDFIARHTLGFEDLTALLAEWDLPRAAATTGIPAPVIRDLAERYAGERPACIIMGYGLQRYANGGQTVRAIDALAALTGQIGIAGGGANYANRSLRLRLHPDAGDSERFAARRRTFALPRMARFIEAADRPPIKALLFTKANPLVQMPDAARLRRAMAKVPFKVAIDLFLTDTAREADLVLPTTHVLEEEDVVASSMFSPYLTYSARAVAPPPGLLGEYELFQRLARSMGLEHYPLMAAETFLRRAVAPLLTSLGLTWEDLKADPVRIPEDDVPWANKRFGTPSGRFEFFSARAAQDGLPPLPAYRPPERAPQGYPLRLLSTHHRHGMHSQYFMDRHDKPTVRLHPDQAANLGLADGRAVVLESPVGQLAAVVRRDPGVPPDVVQVYQGWWAHSGVVNTLTLDALSDMGDNAAYFETFCRIVPAAREAP